MKLKWTSQGTHKQQGGRQGVRGHSLGIKAGGPHLGEAQSALINVDFKSCAHGSRVGTKVPLVLLKMYNILAIVK